MRFLPGQLPPQPQSSGKMPPRTPPGPEHPGGGRGQEELSSSQAAGLAARSATRQLCGCGPGTNPSEPHFLKWTVTVSPSQGCWEGSTASSRPGLSCAL